METVWRMLGQETIEEYIRRSEMLSAILSISGMRFSFVAVSLRDDIFCQPT